MHEEYVDYTKIHRMNSWCIISWSMGWLYEPNTPYMNGTMAGRRLLESCDMELARLESFEYAGRKLGRFQETSNHHRLELGRASVLVLRKEKGEELTLTSKCLPLSTWFLLLGELHPMYTIPPYYYTLSDIFCKLSKNSVILLPTIIYPSQQMQSQTGVLFIRWESIAIQKPECMQRSKSS